MAPLNDHRKLKIFDSTCFIFDPAKTILKKKIFLTNFENKTKQTRNAKRPKSFEMQLSLAEIMILAKNSCCTSRESLRGGS
jgi:hypothetical protein